MCKAAAGKSYLTESEANLGVRTRRGNTSYSPVTCPALQNDRMEKIRDVDEAFTETFNTSFNALPINKQLALIIDPSQFILQGDTGTTVCRPDLAPLEAAIRALCFRLHSARNKLQILVPRRNRKPKQRKPKESQTETSQAH